MIPNVGPLEIAIVLVIALIVFGPKRLPELGRSLGKGINEFREGVSKISEDPEPDADDDTEPVELTQAASTEPEVTEIVDQKAEDPAPKPGADDGEEAVDGEVISERQD